MQGQDLVQLAQAEDTTAAGMRELSAQELLAVAGGGVLLSERTEQVGPVSNGVLLSE